jgi:hypothetical protein
LLPANEQPALASSNSPESELGYRIVSVWEFEGLLSDEKVSVGADHNGAQLPATFLDTFWKVCEHKGPQGILEASNNRLKAPTAPFHMKDLKYFATILLRFI